MSNHRLYSVATNCPHATVPSVLWDVCVDTALMEGRQLLRVPRLETWTLDTLRMVLHELAAYLPPHDDAQVTILAKTDEPKGRPRPDGQPQARRFNNHVEFTVCARGWTVTVVTDRNETKDEKGEVDRVWDTGSWTEPMQAILLDLAARSPFSLSAVRLVECADPRDVGRGLLSPSRRAVALGLEDDGVISYEEPESRKKRIKRLIDEALDAHDDEAA